MKLLIFCRRNLFRTNYILRWIITWIKLALLFLSCPCIVLLHSIEISLLGMFCNLAFSLLNNTIDDLRVGIKYGCHFGKHLLEKVQVDLPQYVVPVLVPIVVLDVLPLLGATRCSFLHAVVQFFDSSALEDLEKFIDKVDDTAWDSFDVGGSELVMGV